MANIFIIHGSYGYPEENWFPWLKSRLEESGHTVIVPQFPTPIGQELNIWLDVFKKYIPKLDNGSILVGHSCGSIFLLRLLERIDVRVKAVFLVAGPVKPLHNDFDKVHMSFVDHPVSWDRIRGKAEHFYTIYSSDDPYVPIEHGEITARQLNSRLHRFKDAGHFNAKAGYLKFDLLLDLINKEIS